VESRHLTTFLQTVVVAVGCLSRSIPAGAAGQAASARTVLARVTSTGNRAVINLGPDDFAVDQNGRSRDVLDVHIADYPIVVLLDDTSNDEEFGAIRKAAIRFIGRVGQRAVAIATLTNRIVASFDDDRAAVLSSVEEAKPSPAAPMPLASVAAAAHLIQEADPGFSAVVILSAQPLDPAAVARNDLLDPVLESGAAVHVVVRLAAPQPSAAQPGDLLKALADQTRGDYVAIYSAASYAIALDRLADRLATEVMIEYLATPDAGPGDVRVGVKIPGARVTGLGVSK
jgi:hypothetical protein